MRVPQNKRILIVDDDANNLRLLSLLCRKQGHTVITASTGAQAVTLARRSSPDCILMDVMMPEMDGFTATAILKEDPTTRHIPVIMVSALDSREDRLAGIEKGADDFLTKPVDASELALRLRNNLRNKEYHDFLADHNRILKEMVEAKTQDLRREFIDTIERLTRASEFKDDETGMHIRRTGIYARELASDLGMDQEFVTTIFHAAPMHDVGKVGIPDAVLLKQGPLTSNEWRVMQGHTELGASLLAGSSSPFLAMGAEIALGHHERWSGGGYPQGRKGEDIPLAARIMNLCDQYDALRSSRPYKPAFDHATACQIITKGDGRTMPDHFDPAILAAFIRAADRFAEIFTEYADQTQEIP